MQLTWKGARAELAKRRSLATQHGGEDAVARHHASGRKTIRERIAALTDDGSFTEIGMLARYYGLDAAGNPLPPTASSYACGLARIAGRHVAIGGEDYTVAGAIPGRSYLDRLKGGFGGFVEDLAHEYRIPLVLCIEGAGGGVNIQQRKGHTFMPSGVSWARPLGLLAEVPVVTAILGPTAGGSAGRAMLTHFSVMTRRTACIFSGGPPLVRRALGVAIDKFALGGAEVHAAGSGMVDNIAEDEDDALDQLRRVLGYLPQNAWQLPPNLPVTDPVDRPCEELVRILPENRRRMYDARKLVNVVIDRDSFFEMGRDWGKAVIAGFARIGGIAVGVLASNPAHLGGALDVPAAEKQTRFVELCDTFHLPIVYFVDLPGFMIGEAAERSGVLRKGMRAVQAIMDADVPIVTVHTRKAYGMAAQATNNPERLGLRLVWPSAEWGDIPVEGGVEAAFRKQIASAPDPAAFRREAEQRLLAAGSPWKGVEAFNVEEMIDPAETRVYVYRFLEASRGSMKARLGPRAHYGPRV